MSGVAQSRAPTFVLVALIGFLFAEGGLRSDELDDIAGEVEEIRQEAAELGPRYLKRGEFKGSQYVAERLIDGENFYRTKDYQRAAIIFMDIIENYPDHAAYSDALFLYADSLFLARDFLGAREWFRRVLDESQKPGARRYRQKAIERLIEIAIHLNKFEGIDKYFDQIGKALTPEAQYVKAKYLYFRGDLDKALQVFGLVTGDTLLEYKALYMMGVILTLQGNHKQAIDIFLKGQEEKANTNEEQEIIDLMNLGAGRLYFEQGFVQHASECYQRIAQNSPHFDAALYEAASVLIRAGDTIRAEQTLEVLTVALPDSRYIPRAKMLRGNLLLRTGRYDEAEKVFDELIEEFTPVMEQLDEVIREQHDTRKFFYELVERSMATLDVSSVLPPLVVKWVGEEPDVRRALELANDLGSARAYVRETERLIRLLEAVIDGPSRINAIPMLREAKRRAQQLSNRLGQLRGILGQIAADRLGGGDSELRRIRQERQALVRELSELPTSDADYKRREKQSREVFRRMSQELSRNAIRIDQLSAMTVAIERFIADPRYTEGVPKESVDALQEELKRYRHAIGGMRSQMSDIKNDVESARYQVGVGDIRDKGDEDLRARIKDLAAQERDLLRGQGGALGKRIGEVYDSINKTDEQLLRFEREVEAIADRRVQEIRSQVRMERDRIAGYNTELRMLDDEAEEVVGGVAFENFSNVRRRFYKLVLNADVGIIDVAWLRKEEHTARIAELTKGRLNEIKNLDDEFHEVRSEKSE